MRLDKISFNRVKGGPLEDGLLVDEGDGPILDRNGKEVPECWDYHYTRDFTVHVSLDGPKEQKQS